MGEHAKPGVRAAKPLRPDPISNFKDRCPIPKSAPFQDQLRDGPGGGSTTLHFPNGKASSASAEWHPVGQDTLQRRIRSPGRKKASHGAPGTAARLKAELRHKHVISSKKQMASGLITMAPRKLSKAAKQALFRERCID